MKATGQRWSSFRHPIRRMICVRHRRAACPGRKRKRSGRLDDPQLWREVGATEAVTAGVGVHHGRIPRALASRFVVLFNNKTLPVLICTSTLIEGVNTAAKSVLIYDKRSTRNYDFFTFSNIRGRAGRLGQHHVGQVYLFHKPPGQEEIEVTAPLFGETG